MCILSYVCFPALRTTNGLWLLGSIISVLGLHRLHQLHILFLRLIGCKTLVNNSLPRSLLRLSLLDQNISAHVLLPKILSQVEGYQGPCTLRSKVPGCSAFVMSSPVATLYKPTTRQKIPLDSAGCMHTVKFQQVIV